MLKMKKKNSCSLSAQLFLKLPNMGLNGVSSSVSRAMVRLAKRAKNCLF